MYTITATQNAKIYKTSSGLLVIPRIHCFQKTINRIYSFIVGYYVIPQKNVSLITKSEFDWRPISDYNEGGMSHFEVESKIMYLPDSVDVVATNNNWFFQNLTALQAAGGDFSGETDQITTIGGRGVFIDKDIPSSDANCIRIFLT